MKSKLLALFAIVLFSGVFQACTEDEVTPVDRKKGVSQGVAEDDKGF